MIPAAERQPTSQNHRTVHETEFYGTYRSISNTSLKLVMEIVFPLLPPRDSREIRASLGTFASSDNVILLPLQTYYK